MRLFKKMRSRWPFMMARACRARGSELAGLAAAAGAGACAGVRGDACLSSEWFIVVRRLIVRMID